MNLEQTIKRALNFVDSQKKYSPACKIIDELIKSIMIYIELVERIQSELEMDNFNNIVNNTEIRRLKAIIALYDGCDTLTEDQANLLLKLKDKHEYYEPMSEKYILFQYFFIDRVLSIKKPEHKTRPTTISEVKKGYEILSRQYGNTENQD